jgi:tetratricopeptide (TPR) repeat protein/tRNA A-37 threonylcarbamoyl transferase component Bud32
MPHDPSAADAPVPPGFEDLLVDLLQAMERQGDTAIEVLCTAHPDHAARLRAHARRLADLGFLATAQASPDLAGLPARLGDYRPLHRIGGGGMGMVYAAEQAALGRRVALKLVRPEQLFAKSARERFAREVHAVARLQHPGIVPVYDAGETAGLPWLAMELVQGASLDRVLDALQGRAPATLTGADLEQAVLRLAGVPAVTGSTTRPAIFTGTWVAACLRLARAIADALVHAHERGVLHRDVKPSNVMLTPDGRALLLDFGLAFSTDSVRLTHGQLGSPAYMSPEQVRGEDVDARTDVWSLGVTLCELLTLRSPFAADTAEATRANVLAARPVRLRAQNPALPRDAELVCLTALGPEPSSRYATMRAFAADLDHLLERRPVQAQPPNLLLVLRRWSQRRPAMAVAAVATVLLLGVAPSVFWLQQRHANQSIRRALAEARTQRDHARAAVQTLLSRVGSEDLREVPHMQGLRRDLLTAARDFHARFLAEAAADPELLDQAAESARELARVDLELGLVEQAHAAAERAVALARNVVGAAGDTPAALAALADALTVLGGAQVQLGRRTEARVTVAEAIRLQRRVVDHEPESPAALANLVEYARLAATTATFLGEHAEAFAALREIGSIGDDARRAGVSSPDLREMVLAAGADEAFLCWQTGDTASLSAAIDRVLARSEGIDPATLTSIERIAMARVHDLQARLLRAGGDVGGAEAASRRSIAAAEALLAELPQHANALIVRAAALNTLAFTLRNVPDRREETRACYADAVATLRRLVAIDAHAVDPRGNLGTTLTNLAAMHFDDRDFARAGELLREATQLLEAVRNDAPDDRRWAAIAGNAWHYAGRLAGEVGDPVAAADAAERVAAAQPDDARAQRVAGMLLGDACRLVHADQGLDPAARDARLVVLQQRCLELLQRAAELGCTDHEFLATSACFSAVRDLPGFAATVERMQANAAAAARK